VPYNQNILLQVFSLPPRYCCGRRRGIELQNQSDFIANLSGWKLNDFIFHDNTFVAPNQFLVLTQPDCSGAFQLFYPDGSMASQIAYSEQKPGGNCVVFDGDNYYWSEISTPGLANIVSAAGLAEEDDDGASLATIKEVRATPASPNKIVLAPNNQFSASAPATEASAETEADAENGDRQSDLATAAENNLLSGQTVNLSQNALSQQKAKMILVLSIILSGSLMVSWLMILIRKKFA